MLRSNLNLRDSLARVVRLEEQPMRHEAVISMLLQKSLNFALSLFPQSSASSTVFPTEIPNPHARGASPCSRISTLIFNSNPVD
jgi:hypothetical protein